MHKLHLYQSPYRHPRTIPVTINATPPLARSSKYAAISSNPAGFKSPLSRPLCMEPMTILFYNFFYINMWCLFISLIYIRNFDVRTTSRNIYNFVSLEKMEAEKEKQNNRNWPTFKVVNPRSNVLKIEGYNWDIFNVF